MVAKGRLQPGQDVPHRHDARAAIVSDDEIKSTLAAQFPYGQWLEAGIVNLRDLPGREHVVFSHDSVLRRQQMFGYTHEELKILITPMALNGMEALGSMGTDTPLAVLSERPRLLFDYFKQLFAQVTNPPLDAIREEVVTAVGSTVGPEANLLEPGPASCRQLILPFPIIDNDELAKIIHIDDDGDRPGSAGGRDLRPVPGRRRRGRAAGGPRRRLREGIRRRSTRAPGSSCCPTATPTRSRPRSRRSCSRPPSTTTWCERSSARWPG